MQRSFGRTLAFICLLGLVAVLAQQSAQAQYKVSILASNQGTHGDADLINAWGLAHGTHTFFWISDNGAGVSTLYTGTGMKQGLRVNIPTASSSGMGSPSGIVFNGSPDFVVSKGQASGSSLFIFTTLDGTVSGWSPGVDLHNAVIGWVTPGAVYSGLAVSSDNPVGSNLLYAANNTTNGQVDVFDKNFIPINMFTDHDLPDPSFAPYGIQVIGHHVFVTFASTGTVPGGVIDEFKESGEMIRRFHTNGPLNQPWGMALAPDHFGRFSRALLVTNNTPDGTINAFRLKDGKFLGSLKDQHHKTIHIDQIWALNFGSGDAANGPKHELFFTAGPINYANGLFGVIKFAPGDGDDDRNDGGDDE